MAGLLAQAQIGRQEEKEQRKKTKNRKKPSGERASAETDVDERKKKKKKQKEKQFPSLHLLQEILFLRGSCLVLHEAKDTSTEVYIHLRRLQEVLIVLALGVLPIRRKAGGKTLPRKKRKKMEVEERVEGERKSPERHGSSVGNERDGNETEKKNQGKKEPLKSGRHELYSVHLLWKDVRDGEKKTKEATK